MNYSNKKIRNYFTIQIRLNDLGVGFFLNNEFINMINIHQ